MLFGHLQAQCLKLELDVVLGGGGVAHLGYGDLVFGGLVGRAAHGEHDARADKGHGEHRDHQTDNDLLALLGLGRRRTLLRTGLQRR